MAALGQPVKCYTVGGWEPQPKDVLALYMNDPSNKKKFLKARDNLEPGNVPGNRVPQYFPVALKDVFGIDATFEWGCSYDQIVEALKAGIGVLICLEDPGHYVAVVAVDTVTEEIIYNDPWPQNYWPVRLTGTSGFNRRMTREEFESNIKPFRIKIGG